MPGDRAIRATRPLQDKRRGALQLADASTNKQAACSASQVPTAMGVASAQIVSARHCGKCSGATLVLLSNNAVRAQRRCSEATIMHSMHIPVRAEKATKMRVCINECASCACTREAVCACVCVCSSSAGSVVPLSHLLFLQNVYIHDVHIYIYVYINSYAYFELDTFIMSIVGNKETDTFIMRLSLCVERVLIST